MDYCMLVREKWLWSHQMMVSVNSLNLLAYQIISFKVYFTQIHWAYKPVRHTYTKLYDEQIPYIQHTYSNTLTHIHCCVVLEVDHLPGVRSPVSSVD